jgi:hypothetical protein
MLSTFEFAEISGAHNKRPRDQEISLRLDPDLIAFVEAYARYSARKDHEAEVNSPPRTLH